MRPVTVAQDGSIKLPKVLLRRFPCDSELWLWTEGDTIVLKRLRPPKASQIAGRVPEKAMAIAEIDAEVQRLRKEKRSRRG